MSFLRYSLTIDLAAILFGGAEPFGQFWQTILVANEVKLHDLKKCTIIIVCVRPSILSETAFLATTLTTKCIKSGGQCARANLAKSRSNLKGSCEILKTENQSAS